MRACVRSVQGETAGERVCILFIEESRAAERGELEILAELLESARVKLLIEIRHTHHRACRDELRHRLTLVESLPERCALSVTAGSV